MGNDLVTKPVCFGDLSASLKVLVVLSWITSVIFILSFTVGFIAGLLGA